MLVIFEMFLILQKTRILSHGSSSVIFPAKEFGWGENKVGSQEACFMVGEHLVNTESMVRECFC